jgi:hypothetical protein
MKLFIDPWKDYSCFVNLNAEWEYKCSSKVHSFLEMSGWNSTKRSTILNKQNIVVANLTYSNSFFKPKLFNIEVFENNEIFKTTINFQKKLNDFPLSFLIKENEYFMEELNSTYRILYENGNQIARFERIQKNILERCKYITIAENHLSKPLLIALSIFDFIGFDNDGMPIDFREINQKDKLKIMWNPK